LSELQKKASGLRKVFFLGCQAGQVKRGTGREKNLMVISGLEKDQPVTQNISEEKID
jgi:hypothetical protein